MGWIVLILWCLCLWLENLKAGDQNHLDSSPYICLVFDSTCQLSQTDHYCLPLAFGGGWVTDRSLITFKPLGNQPSWDQIHQTTPGRWLSQELRVAEHKIDCVFWSWEGRMSFSQLKKKSSAQRQMETKFVHLSCKYQGWGEIRGGELV